jgi:hypothetical protein
VDFRGDVLLAGVDQFGGGRGGGDLVDVPFFNGVAKDDAHRCSEVRRDGGSNA